MAEENSKALKERQAAAEEREMAQRERQAAAYARDDAQQERLGISFYREADVFAASIKEKILKWLVSEDFTARHSTIGEAHSANTGTWLLKQLQP